MQGCSDTLSCWEVITINMDDGVYTGINTFDMKFDTNEEMSSHPMLSTIFSEFHNRVKWVHYSSENLHILCFITNPTFDTIEFTGKNTFL